ncbi:MAG: glycosyltransferase [Bacteroidales bacterium]|nr:glycosyltransferase [Bacteroidales bacterium]
MSAKLVSICCLAYNHGSFIKHTIEGFLNQKTDFPVEIIIHDDASEDDTQRIINQYYKKYPELIRPIIQVENQWRRGVRPFVSIVYPLTRGKYIALCEGDDYWTDPFKLQKQVEFLENNPEYALTATDIELIDVSGSLLEPNAMLLKQRTFLKPDVDFFDLLNNNLINTLTVCFRKDVIRDEAARAVAPDYWFVLDKWLWLNIAIGHKIRIFKDITAAYRIQPASVSHVDSFFRIREDNIRYDVLGRFIEKQGLKRLGKHQYEAVAKTCCRLLLSHSLQPKKKIVVLKWVISEWSLFMAVFIQLFNIVAQKNE